jgi:hypothetical protein
MDPATTDLSTEVLCTRLDDEMVVLHMGRRSYFRLNSTATCVWEGLALGKNPEEIVADLCAAYDVGAEEAARSLETLLGDLERCGLLVRSGRTG